VDDLLGAIAAVTEDGANGRLRFNVSSKWLGGFQARHTPGAYSVGGQEGTHSRDHSLVSDEPAEILGTDAGISPAELILSSLAACLAVGYAANAAALGIELEDLSIEISGDGSLEGFMNIRDARPGLESITVNVNVQTSAPAQAVEELHAFVSDHSPIWDTICNPVNITSRLNVRSS
jgi:uncharacterized OsmC-like protein